MNKWICESRGADSDYKTTSFGIWERNSNAFLGIVHIRNYNITDTQEDREIAIETYRVMTKQQEDGWDAIDKKAKKAQYQREYRAKKKAHK